MANKPFIYIVSYNKKYLTNRANVSALWEVVTAFLEEEKDLEFSIVLRKQTMMENRLQVNGILNLVVRIRSSNFVRTFGRISLSFTRLVNLMRVISFLFSKMFFEVKMSRIY